MTGNWTSERGLRRGKLKPIRNTRSRPTRHRRLIVEALEDRRVLAVTWSVTFIDPGSTYAAYYSRIQSTLLAAANDWGQIFPSSIASIELGVDFTSTPEQRGGGRSETTSFVGTNGALDVFEQSIGREIRTGV